jgi:hypothetical protein
VLSEHGRFQLEATKLGRVTVFQVTVLEKRERRGTRLFAETQCSDPYNFLIQFVIRDAADFDEVLDKFKQQLVYRGFFPVRYRFRLKGEDAQHDKWGEWIAIDIDVDKDLRGGV